MELNYIAYEDLIFSDTPGYDRIHTQLQLHDYSWIHYVLKTEFRTKTQGILYVEFVCNGICFMKVKQEIEDNVYHYEYEFPYDLYKRFIRVFLMEHFESWESVYAFDGGNIVLDFYNNVMDTIKQTKIYH